MDGQLSVVPSGSKMHWSVSLETLATCLLLLHRGRDGSHSPAHVPASSTREPRRRNILLLPLFLHRYPKPSSDAVVAARGSLREVAAPPLVPSPMRVLALD